MLTTHRLIHLGQLGAAYASDNNYGDGRYDGPGSSKPAPKEGSDGIDYSFNLEIKGVSLDWVVQLHQPQWAYQPIETYQFVTPTTDSPLTKQQATVNHNPFALH
jgi:hypothetical protein